MRPADRRQNHMVDEENTMQWRPTPQWIERNEYKGNVPRQQGAVGLVYYGAPDSRQNSEMLVFPAGYNGEWVPEQKELPL